MTRLELQSAIGRTQMTPVTSALEERAEILRATRHLAFPGVRDFTERELLTLANHMQLWSAAAGAVLFEEGAREAWMGIVGGGHVEIRRGGRTRNEHLLATLGLGKVLGEMSLVDGVARSAGAVALTDTLLLVLTKAEFERILIGTPSLGVHLLLALARLLSNRLRATSGRLVDSLSS